MKRAAGLIFADSYDVELDKLTDKRTLAAVPFGGRYRVIDFSLSNMVNAGIRNVGIVMTHRYGSLMNHVKYGGTWDLARKENGLTYLPPCAYDNNSIIYENRLEGIQANLSYIRQMNEDYVIMTCCNYVSNLDLNAALQFHIRSGAKITGLYTKNPRNKQSTVEFTEYRVDPHQMITEVKFGDGALNAGMVTAMNTYIINRDYLVEMAEKTEQESKKSFRRDVLYPTIQEKQAMGYEITETMLFLDTISGYMKSNLELLDPSIRNELFRNPDRPVMTKVKDSAPSRYGKDAVATNSIIADGAVIEGEVHNSIIFRGVRIKKNAIVENSIIMQDTTVGEGVRLNYAVLDKNVIINDGRMLSGYITHPFYVEHRTII